MTRALYHPTVDPATLTPARQAIVQAEIGDAFRAAFLTIAAFTGIGTLLAWSMPLRRL